jgi:prevent-host-death family protein
MPMIRPIKDLRNTNEISELCHHTDEPIFITKNGYGDLVVMSIETYEKTLAKLELYEKLAVAESQVKAGEVLMEAEEAFESVKKRNGRR